MTGLSRCDDVRLSLGVYVVGAIDPAERAVVETHLSQCLDCRAALTGLAGLPALLGRVPARDVDRLAASGAESGGPEGPPAELLGSLLRRVAARRRARRWRTITVAAAAAVIAVATGVAGGAAISHALRSGPAAAPQAAAPSAVRPSGPSSPRYETGRSTNPQTHVTAVVAYYPAPWGTSVRVWVSGIRPGTTCEFWVVSTQGHRSVAGGWTVQRGQQDLWYTVSSSVKGGKIRGFQVTAAGHVLVTVPAT
jgi:hypothetical protein